MLLYKKMLLMTFGTTLVFVRVIRICYTELYLIVPRPKARIGSNKEMWTRSCVNRAAILPVHMAIRAINSTVFLPIESLAQQALAEALPRPRRSVQGVHVMRLTCLLIYIHYSASVFVASYDYNSA